MNYVFHNGAFVDSTKGLLPISNRAFHFADGFFESIRIINGKPFLLQNHFSRMEDAFKAYSLDTSDFTFEKLSEEIDQCIAKNNIEQGGRLRITFSRKSQGYYMPEKNEMEYFIECYPLENNYFKLNDEGMTVDLYPELRKENNKLSMFKNINCSLYILASLYASQKNLDIALIQNYEDTIVEASNANIFIVSNRVLYTPPLSEGCTAGTMRMNIINIALDQGLKTYETELNPQYLLTADEVFLTNAIQGISWVSSYRSKRYINNLSKELLIMLNKFVSEFF